MSDKKTIQEALAEVQRKVNEERAARVAKMSEEIVDEGLLDGAVRAAKNFGANFKKGLSGSNRNVTRGTNNQFASPGGASKAGETFGKGAKVVADNPKTSAAVVGGVAAAGAGGYMAGKNSGSASAADSPAPAPADAPTPPPRPTGRSLDDIGGTPRASATRSAPKPAAAPAAAPAAPAKQNFPGTDNKYGFARSGSDEDTPANFFAADKRMMADKAAGGETESGGKAKKKIKESLMLSFLQLHGDKNPNLFEAVKKMKGKCSTCGKMPCECKSMEEELKGNQDKIDANHNGKVDSQDFKILRGKKKKMEEAAYPPGAGKDTAKDKDPDMMKGSPDEEKAEKKVSTPPKRPTNEETDPGFSEAELAHIRAVMGE